MLGALICGTVLGAVVAAGTLVAGAGSLWALLAYSVCGAFGTVAAAGLALWREERRAARQKARRGGASPGPIADPDEAHAPV